MTVAMRGAILMAGAALLGTPCALAAPATRAAPAALALPPETAALAPGPHVDVAQANCLGCHSADYITTQPRHLPDPRAFWSAEVAKMRRAYGAPIEDPDAKLIVDYLSTAYAR